MLGKILLKQSGGIGYSGELKTEALSGTILILCRQSFQVLSAIN